MDDTTKITLLTAMTGESDESVLTAYLELASAKILNHMYPYVTDISSLSVPSKYDMNTVEIAAYLLNKRGAEGETAHTESGVSRTYGHADVPYAYLRPIIPMSAVLDGNTYVVTYDPNGGVWDDSTDKVTVTGYRGNQITLHDTPTLDDHTFSTWNDGNNDYAAGDTYTITGDVTFTAVWTESTNADTETESTDD